VILGLTTALVGSAAVRIESTGSFDLPLPTVAVAWVDHSRLLVLSAEELQLLEARDGTLVARLLIPGRASPARIAAGLILPDPETSTAWVLSNRRASAVLVEWSSRTISVRSEAPKLPWPGSPTGLHFLPGTNWLDGEVPLVGPGPFLALATGEPSLAVLRDGTVGMGPGAKEELDVGEMQALGPTLAGLWPHWFAASTALPPGEPDALLIMAVSGGRLAEIQTHPVRGSIRALSAQCEGRAVLVALVVEGDSGRFRLEILRLERTVG